MRFRYSACLLLQAVVCAMLVARAEPVGNLRGSITLSRSVPTAGETPSSGYGDAAKPVLQTPLEKKQHFLQEIVVYLADDNSGDKKFGGLAYEWDGTQSPPEIVQFCKAFMPRVLPVLIGTPVAFRNNDPFFHNVFSLSPISRFDLGKYSNRHEPKSYTFRELGVSQIYCDIHRAMKAYVLVLESPFFCQSNAAGEFTIANIPVGRWKAVAWHPAISEATTIADVEIIPDRTTAIAFDIR